MSIAGIEEGEEGIGQFGGRHHSKRVEMTEQRGSCS
jgi:hypothetical protein